MATRTLKLLCTVKLISVLREIAAYAIQATSTSRRLCMHPASQSISSASGLSVSDGSSSSQCTCGQNTEHCDSATMRLQLRTRLRHTASADQKYSSLKHKIFPVMGGCRLVMGGCLLGARSDHCQDMVALPGHGVIGYRVIGSGPVRILITFQCALWPAGKEASRKSTPLMRPFSFSEAMAGGGAAKRKLASDPRNPLMSSDTTASAYVGSTAVITSAGALLWSQTVLPNERPGSPHTMFSLVSDRLCHSARFQHPWV